MKSKYLCYGDNGWLVLDVKDAYLTLKDHDDKIESIFLQNILNKMSNISKFYMKRKTDSSLAATPSS